MTRDEAEEMLVQLTAHYKQPVMPVRRYCRHIETWMCVMETAERMKLEERGANVHTAGPLAHLRLVRTAIQKSNLLYRLIYLGEELRTTPCPVHNGAQSTSLLCLGEETIRTEAGWAKRGNDCGCSGTGWLPNEGGV